MTSGALKDDVRDRRAQREEEASYLPRVEQLFVGNAVDLNAFHGVAETARSGSLPPTTD